MEPQDLVTEIADRIHCMRDEKDGTTPVFEPKDPVMDCDDLNRVSELDAILASI